MARPTARIKNHVSWAVTQLRESFGETMEQFARRMGVALNTVSRWENSLPPSGESLEKLYRVARRRPGPYVVTLQQAWMREEQDRKHRIRLAEIAAPANLQKAQTLLSELYNLQGHLDPGKIPAKRECVLKLADLLCINGRKEIEREDEQ